MKNQLYLYEITRYLAAFTSQVKIENKSGNFDINKYSESFLIPILDLTLKRKFERLEFIKINYPAVDLMSKDSEICVQVTSETGFDKILDTLRGYISNKLYEKSRLIHLVIDEKYVTRKTNEEIRKIIGEEVSKLELSKPPSIEFTTDGIWNVSTLIREIEKNCSVSELEQIRDFLRSQYGDVTSLPTFADVLIPYEVAFGAQIKPHSPNLPFQFDNLFFGRDEEFKSLTDFINSKDVGLTLVADGGYGKTRLCIEFFKSVIDALGDTDAYLLNDAVFNGQIFPNPILPGRKAIILVDDAHKKSEILDGLFSAVKSHENIKIILTVRKALYDDTMRAFSSHSRNIPSIPIKRLTYDNTLDLIKSQVPGVDETQRKGLAEQSKGVPNVVLGLCQMVRKGKYSSEISEEENFIRFVRELKDQIISDISTKYYVDAKHINKTIQLISLLGPIRNEEEEIRALADLNSLSLEECSTILSYLVEHEFIQQKASISILSDPYSDIVLLDMAPRIKFLLKEKFAERFMDRIIRNLVEVEHSERLKLNVDSIVLDFISSISKNPLANNQDIDELRNNLETLKHFAYKKPQIVIRAIELVLKMTEDKASFWLKDYSDWNTGRIREVHKELDTIISIVAINCHGKAELSNIFTIVEEFIRRNSDYNLLTEAFRYREYDFYEYRYRPKIPCERQQFLVERMKDMVLVESLPDFNSQLILKGVMALMSTEFSIRESYDRYKHTISYGNASVIDNEITSKIRNESTEVLITLFNKTRGTAIGNNAYETILRMLHFMAVPIQKNSYVLNQDSQLKLVGTFLLEKTTASFTVEEKGKLLMYLQRYAKREIKPEFAELNQKLFDAASATKNKKERIELLLREEYFFKKKHLEHELVKVLAEYADWNEFYEDAVGIQQNMKGMDAQDFYGLLDHLIIHHKDRSKQMFEFVSKNHPTPIIEFCDLVKANYEDKEYFYSEIDKLWALKTEAAIQAVVYLLTVGRKRDITQYEKRDLDYIEMAINQKNKGAMYRLSVALPGFMDLDASRTLGLCEKFVDSDEGRNTDMLIVTLFEDPDFTKKYKDSLMAFAFNKTLPLRLDSHYLNNIYLFLERDFGFDTLFSFLLKKIEFLEKEVGWHAIDFGGTFNNPSLIQEQKEDNFLKVIDWFVSVDTPSPHVHLKVVEFFITQFTESLRAKLDALVAKRPNSINHLLGICKALDAYENKEGILLKFLISIGNKIVGLEGYSKDKLTSVFGEEFVLNFGSRSKSGSGPFPRDLERQKALKETLAENGMEGEVKEIFEYALKRVEDSIEREIKSDSEEW